MSVTNLHLCRNHKQEWKQSEYSKHNCDYCAAIRKIKELEDIIARLKTELENSGELNIYTV